MSFVSDRKMSMKDFLYQDEPYMVWWKRIRSTPIDYSKGSGVDDLYRTYDLKVNKQKSRRLLLGQIARVAMINRSDTNESSFEEDISDVLCILNDNDMVPFIKNPVFRERSIEPVDYRTIQYRKGRSLRGILDEDENNDKRGKNQMKRIVVGIERNCGSFDDDNGRKVSYDNMVLHCLCINDSPKAKIKMLCGKEITSEQVKVKNDFKEFVYVGDFSVVMDFKDLINCEIEVHRDANNKVECIEVKSIDGEI